MRVDYAAQTGREQEPEIEVAPAEVVAPCQIGVGEYGTQLDEILGLRLVVHEDVAVHILIDIAVRVAAQVGARIDVAQRAALAQNEADVTHASHVQVADRSDLARVGVDHLFAQLHDLVAVDAGREVAVP